MQYFEGPLTRLKIHTYVHTYMGVPSLQYISIRFYCCTVTKNNNVETCKKSTSTERKKTHIQFNINI